MNNQKKLVVLKLLSGLFGSIWIIVSLSAVYFFVATIAFNGTWALFFWVFCISAITKRITSIIEHSQMNFSIDFEDSPETTVAEYNSQEHRLDIISDFGSMIENEKEPMAIKDISFLPHQKEKIVDAIFQEYVLQYEEYTLELLKTGLILISDFQPGVGPTPLTQLGISFEDLKPKNSDDEFDHEEFRRDVRRISSNPTKAKYEHFHAIAEVELESYLKKIELLDKIKDKNNKSGVGKRHPGN